MNSIEQLAAQLQKLMSDLNKRKPQAYDTEAEVLRIDKRNPSLVWVKIPGGVDETPVKRTIDAKPGDKVMVRVSRGRAWINGNGSSPPTDDTKAIIADENALVAGLAAESAIALANGAQEAADKAWEWADDAKNAADEAKDAADDAQDSADAANRYANSALDQLGIVQDVVGVLDWASTHGTFVLTSDTTIVEGKVYFTYDSVSGDYDPVVLPQESALSTYYELSMREAMQTFIMSHLAVTSRGLWVLPNGIGSGTTPDTGESQADSDARQGPNYKALLSNNGMYIYDDTGSIVAIYGENITFSSTRNQTIGNANARIVFDAQQNKITIYGDVKLDNSATTQIDGSRIIANTLVLDASDVIFGNSDNNTLGSIMAVDNINSQTRFGDTNSYHILIDGNPSSNTRGLSFWSGPENVDTNKTAYIEGKYMTIPYTVVINAMAIGQLGGQRWEWQHNEDTHHLTLKWIEPTI